MAAGWKQGVRWSFGLASVPFPLFPGPGLQGTGWPEAVGDDMPLDMEDGWGVNA